MPSSIKIWKNKYKKNFMKYCNQSIIDLDRMIDELRISNKNNNYQEQELQNIENFNKNLNPFNISNSDINQMEIQRMKSEFSNLTENKKLLLYELQEFRTTIANSENGNSKNMNSSYPFNNINKGKKENKDNKENQDNFKSNVIKIIIELKFITLGKSIIN